MNRETLVVDANSYFIKEHKAIITDLAYAANLESLEKGIFGHSKKTSVTCSALGQREL